MTTDKNVYKETLNLPQTNFLMRGNLPQNEPKRIAFWNENNIYEKMLKKNEGKRKFVMPDGPPYANGHLHMGHALNKILKDIIIKYKNMAGFKAAFVPGWDCHGLPIELKVGKKIGSKKNQMTSSEFRNLCRKEAYKWVDIQKKQFIQLGIFADWENSYLTMQPEYEAEEVRVLSKILNNGILYRGKKPVYWCPKLQTALAAAEVEYADREDLSVYVKFECKEKTPLLPQDLPLFFVIWTTTPWTLPANYGICLNPHFEYGVFRRDKEYLIIATKLQAHFEKETGVHLQLEKTLKATDLEMLKARHPFMERNSLLILGNHVTLEAGTGCVHTAPGHGMDDYYIGSKYKLPAQSPVNKSGHYTDEVPQYAGKNIWEANELITEDLKKTGHLIGVKKINHSYPHNPRTKTPLIFRSTPQWFIKMDGKNFNLREVALKATKDEIQFFPQWGQKRLQAMLENTPDWCISRQRTWGVPIPAFYCSSCEEVLTSPQIMNKVADVMESTKKGIEAYFTEPLATFLENQSCKNCGEKKFERGSDILDVWFDSGACHAAVQKKHKDLAVPADIYLEGSDQHRGWFQTSLFSSLASEKTLPFKALITHGFVNDSQGLKMSKSKGNVMDPADIIKKSGSEILRLWVAYEDYGQDVTVSNEMFERIIETYRRIRNTMRFLLGNLYDFNPEKDIVEFKNMPPLDQWLLCELNQLIEKVSHAYESYDFYKSYHLLGHFFTVTLSATYLDILKDRLYTSKNNGSDRRASQTVFHYLTENLITMMAPILSFLSEEVHQFIPNNKYESVFLRNFPKTNPNWKNDSLVEDMKVIFEVKEKVSKCLEEMRKNKEIGSSLDAQLTITAAEAMFSTLKKYQQEPDYLKEILIVSDLCLEKGSSFNIDAQKARGEKCKRCWHYSEQLVTINDVPDICNKCAKAL